MKCNQCEYHNIKHVMIYDTLFDKCSECEIYSIPLSEYQTFILNVLKEFKIGNATNLTYVENLSEDDQKKIDKFLNYFILDFDNLKDSDYKCNACGGMIHKHYVIDSENVKESPFYVCMDCFRLYFFIDQFNILLNEAITNSLKETNIKKRFLQFFKRGKNNVKK